LVGYMPLCPELKALEIHVVGEALFPFLIKTNSNR
jgi:hypothetical protein